MHVGQLMETDTPSCTDTADQMALTQPSEVSLIRNTPSWESLKGKIQFAPNLKGFYIA